MVRVGIYLRVSTKDQTTDNQRIELERVAEQRGWTIVEFFEDAGISGSKGRDKRPAFDALVKAAQRGDINMVAAWSVDRLGRSLSDLVAFLGDLQAIGCNLYLHVQGLDTSTPSGRAMFGMLAVFGEFERAMIVERVHAGIARARAQGKRLGRKPVSPEIEAKIKELRASKMGMLKIAKQLGIGTSVVQRVVGQATPLAGQPVPA